MKVVLLHHTPDPEQAVVLAARLCYSPVDILQLKERVSGADLGAFLQKIMSLGHHSVLEHASFTFGIDGVSRATTHQLVRHRLASYSQQSQRYVSHKDNFRAVIPPSIAQRPELLARYEEGIRVALEAYTLLLEEGIPAEDARYLLPNATESKIMVTMNARELRHFFLLRCCERAQWEIRAMAREMLLLVRNIAPLLFGDAGPGCLSGSCPEGAMTCGRMAEVRQLFRTLN